MARLDFTGKVAIVTGASRGIGPIIALGLAKHGASVVGTSRRLDSSAGAGGTLKETVGAIERLGGFCLPVPADITTPARAQNVDTFTGQVVRRAEFGQSWGEY
jgi:NAD(P)-dependent dehydrogenase (short-subunit alcohol dehydrogenase family)